MTANSKSITYFVTEDWYFCSHRLQLAVAAKAAGYTVYVVTHVESHGAEIEAAGLNLIPVNLSRRSKNLFVELIFIAKLVRVYRDIEPDITHNVALKPVLYGSIAAWLAGVPAVVNAMAGLGFLFTSDRKLARVLRPVIRGMFKILLNNRRTVTILQNPDDIDALCSRGTVNRNRIRLIRGSGVDTDVYEALPEPDGIPVVLLASRMLWDKGIGQFVEAAGILKRGGVVARFVLAGEGDEENPGSISSDQLRAWHQEGNVEWWGRCSDMPTIFAEIHVVCLPTAYGEGVPKVLIEAASCGRPIVATDAPGCREIVIDGQNGMLVPVGDVEALVVALCELLQSPDSRKRMGQAGRQLVIEEFALEKVISETLDVYGSITK
ncbi:MAG TPA: glycosyltransferase family 4 protein [Woeseiaceae bacterium]|nr:glycosyltransferase family 4 protein [Woeseiaceae bacterium]